MRYWKLQNSDGKCWIIPIRNVSTALGLYQPSYWKGRLLKALLPTISRVRKVYAPFPLVDDPMDDNLRHQLEKVFLGHCLEYSMFLGTPSVHQKTVIQIFEGDHILGYAKVSDKDCVMQLFDHEESILQDLNRKGLNNIPKCIFNQMIDTKRKLFVMTSSKTKRSKVLHEWTDLHEEFMNKLHTKTHQRVLFENSDYAQMLTDLKQHLHQLPDGLRTIVSDTIDSVIGNYQGRMCDMSTMHGDFTPWNMFVEGQRLFVFDWEYARENCPSGIDRYHFLIQHLVFEMHWDVGQIANYISSDQTEWIDKEKLTMYLLAVISIYVCREIDVKENSQIIKYISLLKSIN